MPGGIGVRALKVETDAIYANGSSRIFNASKGRYGSPRVYQSLLRQGVRCSENTVAALMHDSGLKARVYRVYKRNPKVHRYFKWIQNLRLNGAGPSSVDQVWVGDLTYIKIGKRYWFMAAIMDAFSRRLIGWSISKRRNTKLTERALLHAIRKRQPARGLIFHSDRGVEYCSYRYHAVMNRHGIVHSVNRPGCCQYNAEIESFFHTLKGELIRKRNIRNGRDLRNIVRGYIVHFYNRKRLHSSLNYCSPLEYELTAGYGR